MSEGELELLELKKDKEQQYQLDDQFIIDRTCFIDGMKYPDALPIMTRTIANRVINMRVCSSCQTSLMQFTPARITSFVSDDEKGVFGDKDPNKHDHNSDTYCGICIPIHRMRRDDKATLTLDKMQEMTRERLVGYMVLHEIEGWHFKMNKNNLIELIVDTYEEKIK